MPFIVCAWVRLELEVEWEWKIAPYPKVHFGWASASNARWIFALNKLTFTLVCLDEYRASQMVPHASVQSECCWYFKVSAWTVRHQCGWSSSYTRIWAREAWNTVLIDHTGHDCARLSIGIVWSFGANAQVRTQYYG